MNRELLRGSICRILISVSCIILSGRAKAEGGHDHMLDSLQKAVNNAKSDADKVYTLYNLSHYYTVADPKLSDKYAAQAAQTAELSRDRKLIVISYLRNGNRHTNMSSLEGMINLAIQDYEHAEQEAKNNGLPNLQAFAEIGLARANRAKGDYAAALNYNHMALSIADGSGDDSLKVAANNSLGTTYRFRNEKLLAFRSYLESLDVAEQSKRDDLLKLAYSVLSDLYGNIDEIDKAIDYEMKMMQIDQKHQNRYELLDDYNNLGKMFVAKKQYDLALSMFEHSLALADSLQFETYKSNSYLNIVNMYFDNNQYAIALKYLNDHRDVTDFFTRGGLGVFFDEGFGGLYMGVGKYDSALYFFKKAEPEIEKMSVPLKKADFYELYGTYYKLTRQYPTAIQYYLKANAIGDEIKELAIQRDCATNLDTLYTLTGDYKAAYTYNARYNVLKDSLQALAKDADLLRLEVESDNRRHERLVKEEEEATVRRHNIQYMGLTAGLATLFIILVMLGFFMVSPRTIRALGFFSFIFLFEFIIMIADHQIHEMTHGEPWKVLLIKIGLAAILLPLHHWLEHKVIHYLNTRRKLPAPGLLRKKKATVPEAAVEAK